MVAICSVFQNPASASATELRALVHWKDDERRLADVNVFFIPAPGPTAA